MYVLGEHPYYDYRKNVPLHYITNFIGDETLRKFTSSNDKEEYCKARNRIYIPSALPLAKGVLRTTLENILEDASGLQPYITSCEQLNAECNGTRLPTDYAKNILLDAWDIEQSFGISRSNLSNYKRKNKLNPVRIPVIGNCILHYDHINAYEIISSLQKTRTSAQTKFKLKLFLDRHFKGEEMQETDYSARLDELTQNQSEFARHCNMIHSELLAQAETQKVYNQMTLDMKEKISQKLEGMQNDNRKEIKFLTQKIGKLQASMEKQAKKQEKFYSSVLDMVSQFSSGIANTGSTYNKMMLMFKHHMNITDKKNTAILESVKHLKKQIAHYAVQDPLTTENYVYNIESDFDDSDLDVVQAIRANKNRL